MRLDSLNAGAGGGLVVSRRWEVVLVLPGRSGGRGGSTLVVGMRDGYLAALYPPKRLSLSGSKTCEEGSVPREFCIRRDDGLCGGYGVVVRRWVPVVVVELRRRGDRVARAGEQRWWWW